MQGRPRRGTAEMGEVVLVASDPQVIAVARDAACRLSHAPPVLLASGQEALERLVGPGEGRRHIILEHGAAAPLPPDLLEAARDPFLSWGVVVVDRGGAEPPPPGLRIVPAEPGRLAAALTRTRTDDRPLPDSAALEAGLLRGEVTVRFQPIVRIADRRPAMVEALARWERPSGALGPGDFVALAERTGLGTRLTVAVAKRAMAEFAPLSALRGLQLSFNMPLPALLDPGAPAWLGAAVAECGLSPRSLWLELTESIQVRDRALLRRALVRLRRVGFGVLLDDLGLDDPRHALMDLPFAGVKLDRGMVSALPVSRRARAQAERITRRARAAGMVVIAEGVTDPALWRAVATLGCDMAQGFGVGRPLPAAALPAWTAAWAAAGRRSV